MATMSAAFAKDNELLFATCLSILEFGDALRKLADLQEGRGADRLDGNHRYAFPPLPPLRGRHR